VEWDVLGIDGDEIPPDVGGDGQRGGTDTAVVEMERVAPVVVVWQWI
jgi:hypothetical protein